jgi:hypothetical protein
MNYLLSCYRTCNFQLLFLFILELLLPKQRIGITAEACNNCMVSLVPSTRDMNHTCAFKTHIEIMHNIHRISMGLNDYVLLLWDLHLRVIGFNIALYADQCISQIRASFLHTTCTSIPSHIIISEESMGVHASHCIRL